MSETGGEHVRRWRDQPGIGWVTLVAGVGIAAAIIIVWNSEPAARWSAGLGTASQVAVAAFVAAFGVLQVSLAREAVASADRNVAETQEQTETMRKQLEQANEDAAASKVEAERQQAHAVRVLEASIRERLDRRAPRVTIEVRQTDDYAAPIMFNHGGTDRPVWVEAPVASHLAGPVVAEYRIEFDVVVHVHGSVPAHVRMTSRRLDTQEHFEYGAATIVDDGTLQSSAFRRTFVHHFQAAGAPIQNPPSDPFGYQPHPFEIQIWVQDFERTVRTVYTMGVHIEEWVRQGIYLQHESRSLIPDGVTGSERFYVYLDSEKGRAEVMGGGVAK